jgi:galactokinase
VSDIGAADRAADWFGSCFGRPADGVWHAPGRVNFIGEHTDYNQGFVLPFALRQGVVAAAAARPDATLELRSSQARAAVTIDLDHLAPSSVTGWAAYPAGVAWALREAGYPLIGADLAIDSDLPTGAGLSSSAALECAVALALTDLAGVFVPPSKLAEIARRAENDFVGVPTGVLDQSASLLCEAGHVLLLDCQAGTHTAIPFDLASAGLTLLIIDTGTRRSLTDGRYAARRRDCEQAAEALGVNSLRDLSEDPGALSKLADPQLLRRARHVLTENARVLEAVALMQAGQLGSCGALLSASHRSLRAEFEVSWPEADIAVAAAVAAGALGARMTGGGFAGSVIALAEVDRQDTIKRSVSEVFVQHRWPAPRFLTATPSPPAHRIR